MQKLIFVLALGALGLAVWQTLEAGRLRSELDLQRHTMQGVQTDVARLSSEFEALASFEAAPAFSTELAVGDAPAEAEDGAAEPRLAARGASPVVLAKAMRNMQEEIAELKQRDEEMAEKIGNRPARLWRAPKFIRDVESARKLLDLDAGQQADMERAIEYAKRDLEQLHDTPNDEGKTWKDVSKVKLEGAEGMAVMMSNFGAIQKFKQSTIPGSNETFGQAENRIRQRGKQEVRDILTPEQQKTFDESHTDALFGSQGGSVITFATSVEVEGDD